MSEKRHSEFLGRETGRDHHQDSSETGGGRRDAVENSVTVPAIDLHEQGRGSLGPNTSLKLGTSTGNNESSRNPKGLAASDSQNSLPETTKGNGKCGRRKTRRHVPYQKHPLVVEVLRAAASSDTPYRRHAAYDYLRILPRVNIEDEPIIVILGKNVPYHQYEREISLRFLLFVMHLTALSQRQKYRLVYVHRHESGVSGPGLHWLLLAFRQMPRRATRLLSTIVVVNADALLHLSRWTILPFLNYRVWRKLRFGGVLDDLHLQDHPYIAPFLQLPRRRGRGKPMTARPMSPPLSATAQSPRTETDQIAETPIATAVAESNDAENANTRSKIDKEQIAIAVPL